MDYTMSHPHIISQQGVWRYLSGEWCEGARFESTKKMETTSTYADCTVQRIVTPAQALILFLTRLTPKGRSSRSEFWWVFLVFTLAHFALGANFGQGNPYNMILLLLSYYPFMCLQFRRFHDIGRNTIWVKIAVVTLLIILCTWFISLPKVIWLISLIVNIIAASVILCCDCYKSVPHANEHGEVPHTYADDVAKELAKKNKNRANPKTAASTDVRIAGRYSRLKLHKEAEIAKTTTGTISIRSNTVLVICIISALTALGITALALFSNRYQIVTVNKRTMRINRLTGKSEHYSNRLKMWISPVDTTAQKSKSFMAKRDILRGYVDLGKGKYKPLDAMTDEEQNILMDEAGACGIMREWDRGEGRKYTDPDERRLQRAAYMQEIMRYRVHPNLTFDEFGNLSLEEQEVLISVSK